MTQGNLANTYQALGREEEALRVRRDVYSGRLKVNGEEHRDTFVAANNYANSFRVQDRFEEAKVVLRRMMPVARRVLGEGDRITLTMRRTYAQTLYKDSSATLDDLREAVETLEDTQRIAQRVLGSANPTTVEIEGRLRNARAALGSREMTASGRGTTRAGDVRALREAVAAMSTTSD
jgi:hypothetical protein